MLERKKETKHVYILYIIATLAMMDMKVLFSMLYSITYVGTESLDNTSGIWYNTAEPSSRHHH